MNRYTVVVAGPDGSGRRAFVAAVADVMLGGAPRPAASWDGEPASPVALDRGRVLLEPGLELCLPVAGDTYAAAPGERVLGTVLLGTLPDASGLPCPIVRADDGARGRAGARAALLAVLEAAAADLR